jgi:Transposase
MKFREKLQPYSSIPFAIKTSQGAAVEHLSEAGMIVYPLNPKSAQAYRERKAPSGVKDDRLDAWSFADALRVDGQGWKALRPEEPLIKELRLLCRDEVALIEQRTAFIQQLRHALAEYYPAALEAFEGLDQCLGLDVFAALSYSAVADSSRQAQMAKLPAQPPALGQRPGTSSHGNLCPRPGICWYCAHRQSQKSLGLESSLVQILFAIEKQPGLYRQRIEELFCPSSRS